MSIPRKLIVVSLSLGIAASLLSTLGLLFFYSPFGGVRTAVAMLIAIAMMLTWVTRCVFVLIQHRKKRFVVPRGASARRFVARLRFRCMVAVCCALELLLTN